MKINRPTVTISTLLTLALMLLIADPVDADNRSYIVKLAIFKAAGVVLVIITLILINRWNYD